MKGGLLDYKELRLKFQDKLKKRKSKKYLHFRASKKKTGNDNHHIIGKNNDFLLCEMSHKLHMENPNVDFDDQLVNALENLFDYVEFLEENIEFIKNDNLHTIRPGEGFNEDF